MTKITDCEIIKIRKWMERVRWKIRNLKMKTPASLDSNWRAFLCF